MKSLASILLGLLCLNFFMESGVNGQPLVPSKEAAVRTTTDGPSLGALKRYSPSAVVQSVAVLTDSALPAGVYFYRLEAGTSTSVKKMLLLK